MKQRVKCNVCLSAFLSTSDVAKDTLLFSCGQMPSSFEKFINPHKELIHPNCRMYQLILRIETLFRKYCNFRNAFDLILDELTSSSIHLQFECNEHENDALEILAYVIKFYLQIRMREFLKKQMMNLINKLSQLKRKKPSFAQLD